MGRNCEGAALYVVFSSEAGRLVQMRGYQPPLALCANPHGPRDPTQSVCCSRIRSRLDSGALMRETTHKATASMEILTKAVRFFRLGWHLGVLSLSWITGGMQVGFLSRLE